MNVPPVVANNQDQQPASIVRQTAYYNNNAVRQADAIAAYENRQLDGARYAGTTTAGDQLNFERQINGSAVNGGPLETARRTHFIDAWTNLALSATPPFFNKTACIPNQAQPTVPAWGTLVNRMQNYPAARPGTSVWLGLHFAGLDIMQNEPWANAINNAPGNFGPWIQPVNAACTNPPNAAYNTLDQTIMAYMKAMFRTYFGKMLLNRAVVHHVIRTNPNQRAALAQELAIRNLAPLPALPDGTYTRLQPLGNLLNAVPIVPIVPIVPPVQPPPGPPGANAVFSHVNPNGYVTVQNSALAQAGIVPQPDEPQVSAVLDDVRKLHTRALNIDHIITPNVNHLTRGPLLSRQV